MKLYNIKEKQEYIKEVAELTKKEWSEYKNIEELNNKIERNLVAIPLTLDDGSRLKKLFSKICRKTLTN